MRDGAKADPPIEPITLCQIAKSNSRDDWRWHDEGALTELLTKRTKTYRLWTAQVPPDRLFAQCSEIDPTLYIVDTDSVDISEYGTDRKKQR